MNHQQGALREPAPTAEYEPHLKPHGELRSERQARRSPLPSARELDLAIARKYGCPPYRDATVTSA